MNSHDLSLCNSLIFYKIMHIGFLSGLICEYNPANSNNWRLERDDRD